MNQFKLSFKNIYSDVKYFSELANNPMANFDKCEYELQKRLFIKVGMELVDKDGRDFKNYNVSVDLLNMRCHIYIDKDFVNFEALLNIEQLFLCEADHNCKSSKYSFHSNLRKIIEKGEKDGIH